MMLTAVRHRPTRAALIQWLHQLDSYTNAEFGHSRTLLAHEETCVACGGITIDPDVSGLCARCAKKRHADHTEIILFRPLRNRATGGNE